MTGLSQMPADRQAHWLRSPLHQYAIPVSPKTLAEALCTAQVALGALEREGVKLHSEAVREVLLLLLDECSRKRPTGPDGKHGSRHTGECGCQP